MIRQLLHPPLPHRSLQDALVGRLLTGIFIDEDDPHLHLRFTDAVLGIDLTTGEYLFKESRAVWLSFPGWLRIVKVLRDTSQIVLITSGAVYSAALTIRNSKGRWSIVFPADYHNPNFGGMPHGY